MINKRMLSLTLITLFGLGAGAQAQGFKMICSMLGLSGNEKKQLVEITFCDGNKKKILCFYNIEKLSLPKGDSPILHVLPTTNPFSVNVITIGPEQKEFSVLTNNMYYTNLSSKYVIDKCSGKKCGEASRYAMFDWHRNRNDIMKLGIPQTIIPSKCPVQAIKFNGKVYTFKVKSESNS